MADVILPREHAELLWSAAGLHDAVDPFVLAIRITVEPAEKGETPRDDPVEFSTEGRGSAMTNPL